MATRRYIVSYDCSDDRRRWALHRLLSGYGVWVQFSVFECAITELELRRLLRAVERCIDASADSVLVHQCAATGAPPHRWLAAYADQARDFWIA
jgi:CRISPR-associated protein Cas2